MGVFSQNSSLILLPNRITREFVKLDKHESQKGNTRVKALIMWFVLRRSTAPPVLNTTRYDSYTPPPQIKQTKRCKPRI